MIGDFDGNSNALWTFFRDEANDARINNLKDDMESALLYICAFISYPVTASRTLQPFLPHVHGSQHAPFKAFILGMPSPSEHLFVLVSRLRDLSSTLTLCLASARDWALPTDAPSESITSGWAWTAVWRNGMLQLQLSLLPPPAVLQYLLVLFLLYRIPRRDVYLGA